LEATPPSSAPLDKKYTFCKIETVDIYIKRKLEDQIQKYHKSREAIVVTGFRSVGKTALMQNIYKSINSKNKLFLDLESPVNQKIFNEKNYDNIAKAFASYGIDTTQQSFIFIDEIQMLKSTTSIVKYLYDHYNFKFYLTGSSSFYLRNYFSESMAGRKFIFELYPLDFEEFLRFKKERLTINAPYDLLSGLYKEYIQYGGFPSVVLASSIEQKILALDNILGSYFELDVKNLSDFRNNENLKKLLFLLASRVGSKLEITKLSESLNVSRPTVYEYLSFFEQTYLIHLLRPFSGSRDIQIKSIPKLYFNDTGILNRVSQMSLGHLFENKVFNQLYTKNKYLRPNKFLEETLSYYQAKSGSEIDFIERGQLGYEVKVNAVARDYAKLIKAGEKINLKDYKIVSLESTELVKDKKAVYPFGI